MAVAVLVTAVTKLALVLLRRRLGLDPPVHAGHVHRIKLCNWLVRHREQLGHVELPDLRRPGATVAARPAAYRRQDSKGLGVVRKVLGEHSHYERILGR